jgi:hypothetical protein
MSLYRVASRRRRPLALLVPAAVLLVGLLAGFVFGRMSAPDPTVEEALSEPAARVAEARTALDVLTIEYPQAVSNGAVRAATEYEGAQTDVRRAQDALRAAAELQALDPEGYRQADELLADIGRLVEQKAAPAAVEVQVRRANEVLASLPGVGSGSG